jgi:hypothetical protein
MKMKPETRARLAYVGLIGVSLAIPVLYHALSADAVRSTRGSIGLTPVPFLLVNWFGEWAEMITLGLVILFACSWKYERLLKASTLAWVCAGLLAFNTVFGTYCCFVLSHVLLNR